jgi:hypothetical protein
MKNTRLTSPSGRATSSTASGRTRRGRGSRSLQRTSSPRPSALPAGAVPRVAARCASLPPTRAGDLQRPGGTRAPRRSAAARAARGRSRTPRGARTAPPASRCRRAAAAGDPPRRAGTSTGTSRVGRSAGSGRGSRRGRASTVADRPPGPSSPATTDSRKCGAVRNLYRRTSATIETSRGCTTHGSSLSRRPR